MKFQDCCAEIKGWGNKKVGEVCGTMGGGVEIIIGRRHWFIGPVALYEAVKQADDAYLAAQVHSPIVEVDR